MNKLLTVILSLILPLSVIAAEGFSSLEEQMSGKEFTATGLNKLKDGRLLFVWSDRHIPSMRIAISEDRGKTWTDRNGFSIRDGIHIVDDGNLPQVLTYDGSTFGGPYSDIGEPCTTQLANGKIVTVYYWFISRENPIRYIEAAIYDI